MKISNMTLAALLAVRSLLFTVASVSADEEADHAALRELVKHYEATIEKGDPSLLKPYLAPGFTGVMVTGEEVSDYQSLEAYWRAIQQLLGEGGKYTVKVSIPAPATIVGDLAFAHGTTADKVLTSAGKEFQFKGFWTAIATRQGDGWKIVRIHGSMDAINNAFVATKLRATVTLYAIVAGIVGLAIGAIAQRALVNRRSRPTTAA